MSENPSAQKEPCKHDKGVEVHRGEVYCFKCGEHLGKEVKVSKLKRFIKNSVTFNPLAQKVAKEEGLGKLSKDEVEWLRYVVLNSLKESKRVSGEASGLMEEIRKHAFNVESLVEDRDSNGHIVGQHRQVFAYDVVQLDVVLGVVAKGLFSAEKPPLKTIRKQVLDRFAQRVGKDNSLAPISGLLEVTAEDIESLIDDCISSVFDGTFPKSSAEAERNQRIVELREEYDELSKIKANLDVDRKCGYHVDVKFYRLVLKVLKTLENALVCEGLGKSQPPKTETKQQ